MEVAQKSSFYYQSENRPGEQLGWIIAGMDLINQGVIIANDSGKIVFINNRARQLTNCRISGGKPVWDTLKLFDESGVQICGSFQSLLSLGNTAVSCARLEVSDKPPCYVDIRMSALSGKSGENTGLVISIQDAGKEKGENDEIQYLKWHDCLTGLYNRTYFEKILERTAQQPFSPICLMVGDVNGLRFINNVFGYRTGDTILTAIANILCICCKDNDVIARWGDDEFVILMPEATCEQVDRLYKRILSLCVDSRVEETKVSLTLGYAIRHNQAENIYHVLRAAEDFMYKHKLFESSSSHSAVLSSLRRTLYEKSYETEEHATRLTRNCIAIGRELGMSESTLNDLKLFAMLHDIGKIAVSDSILQKPGPLTDPEWTEMKKHSEAGYRIARTDPELASIADYIRCHHERWDGNGYPNGLKGKRIPLPARILSVADAYDAMVNNRCYRKALSKEAAIGELKKNSGIQFDPAIVDVFLKLFASGVIS